MRSRTFRPALQPQVELDDQYEPGKDAEVYVSLEALPDVPPAKIDGLKLERLTVEPDEELVDEQIEQIASQSKRWEDAPKKHGAATGDLVVMDFEGEVDGKPFEGGKGEDMSVELGSGRLIPGFEDQLVGVKAGDSREVKVTFPDDYPVDNLKGKDATFAVSVKGVKTAGETKLDDELAKTLGLNDLDQFKGLVRGQIEQELSGLTRTHMKRQLLDVLAERHDFVVPESMVEAEYQNILNQLRHEASHEADPEAALEEIEKESADYRRIAERRVRLGLLLSEVGAANGVEITEQEMNRLVAQSPRNIGARTQKRFIQLVQENPMFAAQIRAPLYEDKVVDFLFSKADITDRKATREQLEADLESEEGHVHGPDCGHDHAPKSPRRKRLRPRRRTLRPKVEAKEPAKAKSRGRRRPTSSKNRKRQNPPSRSRASPRTRLLPRRPERPPPSLPRRPQASPPQRRRSRPRRVERAQRSSARILNLAIDDLGAAASASTSSIPRTIRTRRN